MMQRSWGHGQCWSEAGRSDLCFIPGNWGDQLYPVGMVLGTELLAVWFENVWKSGETLDEYWQNKMDDGMTCSMLCVSNLILTSRESVTHVTPVPVWLPFSIRKLYWKNVTTVKVRQLCPLPTHQAPFSLLFLAVGVFFSWTPDVVADFQKQFLGHFFPKIHPSLIS